MAVALLFVVCCSPGTSCECITDRTVTLFSMVPVFGTMLPTSINVTSFHDTEVEAWLLFSIALTMLHYPR